MMQKKEIENETLKRAGMKAVSNIGQYQICDWGIYDSETDLRLAYSATKFEHGVSEAEDDLKETIGKIMNNETHVKIFEGSNHFWWALLDEEKMPVLIDSGTEFETEQQTIEASEKFLLRLTVDSRRAIEQ